MCRGEEHMQKDVHTHPLPRREKTVNPAPLHKKDRQGLYIRAAPNTIYQLTSQQPTRVTAHR